MYGIPRGELGREHSDRKNDRGYDGRDRCNPQNNEDPGTTGQIESEKRGKRGKR